MFHYTDEELTGGKVNAVVMLGSFPYQKTYEVCDLLKDVNIVCPVKSGNINFGIKMNIPEFTPSVSHMENMCSCIIIISYIVYMWSGAYDALISS